MPSTRSMPESTSVLVVGTTDWPESFAETVDARTDATVHRADGTAAALEVLDRRAVDCVVTDHDLEAGTGLDLLRTVRDRAPELPVVVATRSGGETVASDAIRAGVTDYVPLPPDGEFDAADLLERTARALETAARTDTRRERARQFDAVFDDASTATWVLAPDGALRRANERAREMIDEPDGAIVGEPFWTLPWWAHSDALQADVERLVETARDGRFGNAVIAQPPSSPDPRVFDLSVRPVADERGALVSIVVEGVDITDRVELERDLRASEELHRVTLNNMTDTVLITDEDGAYTYVCPNVHFIFGYTAEEIHGMGTIDELLGEDLFDRDELASTGVLKNIECTATDKAGHEHTLLINVREVAIQDGTLLYSCRDITKRKQREEALATLQETAREFLYAETHEAIAQHVVDDTPGVLDLEASAVYLFDTDTGDLRPAAHSPQLKEIHGPLPTVPTDGESLVSHCFVENEPLFFEDVHEADRLRNRATDLRGTAFVPLGEHGVFVAGTETVGGFDEVTRELADLLAATAEAALDRVTREAQLREQDRTLQQRNAELSRLNRINETIREIDGALVGADTRAEIDAAVCELLTDDDRFRFAWVGTVDPSTRAIEPRAWAGDGRGYLDSRAFVGAESSTEPTERTAATGEVTAVPNVAAGLHEAPWRRELLASDHRSVLSIPLRYNEFTHGVLTVTAGTQDAFDDVTRAVMAELGETIASALSALERKHALLTTGVTRVEIAIDDPSFVLTRLARAADCTLSYRGGVQQTGEGQYVFVTVDGAALDAVEAAAADLVSVDDVRAIGRDGADAVLRLELTEPFLALELADHGAVLREATADDTATTLLVDVPDGVAVRNVTQLVRETFPEMELRSKRTLDRAADHDLYARVLEDLTDRQLEVVQTAYYSGFFESPRDSTGEEVAGTLDISSTAFYRHVRTVQRTLFGALFEERDPPLPADGG